MLSIGQFAKLAQVSARTVRYYESIGLIASASRGDNNYRYYDNHLVDKVVKIRDLQGLGFSLDEIKDILKISPSNFTESLRKKLQEVAGEIKDLSARRERLLALLSVSQKIETGESINDTERRQYMDAIKEEILGGLRMRQGEVTEAHLKYLDRDQAIFGGALDTLEKQEFVNAIKKCIEFAKSHNLKLGPGRGSSPASLVLYALGFTSFDPSPYEFFPERLSTQPPDIHMDVEFERGQEFVDYCRELSKELSYGQINAFKMPLIDIVKNVHERLGHEINYDEIDDDSDIVLNPFRTGNIEKIFCFDMSEDTLIMKYEGMMPGYMGMSKMLENIKSQEIYNFRDIINLTSLWRPYSQAMIDRIERYREAKKNSFNYDFLTPELQESLKPNFGLIIYQEDILRILATYTPWSLERCNQFRRNLQFQKEDAQSDLVEFRNIVPPKVFDLVVEENQYVFCQPHAIAFATFVKQTAVLKSLHQEIYYEEISKWEKKHGFRWDDIGVKLKGVSLLQN